MTPGESVRKFCVQCVGGESHSRDVKDCGGDHCLNGGGDEKGICYFYKYRMSRGRPSVKTIRKMCLYCMCGSSEQIKECTGNVEKEGLYCPLWEFRFGRNPNFELSEEDKNERRSRLGHVRSGGLL